MEKKAVTATAIILLGLGPLVQAQGGDLRGVFDVTYQSKYLWRGIDVFDDKSAVQPSLDLDLFATGFGLRVEGHRANSSGFEQRSCSYSGGLLSGNNGRQYQR